MIWKIISKIKNKALVLFGEIHGTKEIPELLSRLFVEMSAKEDFNLCLEIPVEFQNSISLFMKTSDENLLKTIPFFSKNDSPDGRNSLEYLNLIRDICEVNLRNKKRIKIFCIDPSANSQKEKEEGLADNIIKSSKNKKTFVILGNIHASKEVVNLPGISIIPTGRILSEKLGNQVFTINILPLKGKFFNLGIKEIKNNSKDSNYFVNKGFDYILEIKSVTPCSFL